MTPVPYSLRAIIMWKSASVNVSNISSTIRQSCYKYFVSNITYFFVMDNIFHYIDFWNVYNGNKYIDNLFELCKRLEFQDNHQTLWIT